MHAAVAQPNRLQDRRPQSLAVLPRFLLLPKHSIMLVWRGGKKALVKLAKLRAGGRAGGNGGGSGAGPALLPAAAPARRGGAPAAPKRRAAAGAGEEEVELAAAAATTTQPLKRKAVSLDMAALQMPTWQPAPPAEEPAAAQQPGEEAERAPQQLESPAAAPESATASAQHPPALPRLSLQLPPLGGVKV